MAGVHENRRGESIALALGMVLVQAFTMGMLLLSKKVLSDGTLIFAFLGYRNAIGALFMVPFALFFEREIRQKLSWSVLLRIFITTMLGMLMAMGFYYYGLRDTSAAYSANFLNLIPVVTFIFAIIIRFERLGLGTKAGKAKILGTLICVGGAMVISLYKGKEFYLRHSGDDHKHHSLPSNALGAHLPRGTLFLVASCISSASWFVAQAKLYEEFPYKYWATTLTCVFGCLQTIIVGIAMDRRRSAWSLKWDLKLITIFYSGILNSGATFCLISWAISRRGPAYPSMFNPLAVIFTLIAEALFMGHAITVGSLLGTIFIIGGLYAFLWGKAKEISPSAARVTDSQQDSDVEK